MKHKYFKIPKRYPEKDGGISININTLMDNIEYLKQKIENLTKQVKLLEKVNNIKE